MDTNDRGSTLPLMLGFFVVAATTVAAAVAAGDAFVHQRGLQDVCDGVALSAAASAVQVGRSGAGQASLTFDAVSPAIHDYLARDTDRRDVRVSAALSDGGRTLGLTCSQTEPVTFGALFGLRPGVHHVVHSAARAPVR